MHGPRAAFRHPPGRSLVLTLALALAAGACSESPTAADRRGPPRHISELPRDLSDAEVRVLSASNRFAFDLARRLAPGDDGNLFFSPLSASMALGMTLNGADGGTFAQMRDVLGFEGMEQAAVNAAYRDLIDLLVDLDPSVRVEIANSVWYREGYPVLPDFLERVETHFSAEVEAVDFGDGATLPRINAWVEEATDGTIETIFDSLPGSVVMVLLNAIYFRGDWTVPFDPDQTRPADFTRGDGSTVSVDLMARDAEVPFASGDGWTAVDLPYGGEAFSMTLVLPDPGSTPADLLDAMDLPAWEALAGSFDSTRVAVQLPRFEMEWEDTLNAPLRALGMADAFDPALADFSRMVPGGGVWIDLVKQKAFVTVDEEGTEASASTGVVLTDSLPPSLRLDRPFLVVIRERLSGTVLFMGIVNDPSA